MEQQFGWWLPKDISTHGAAIDELINIIHWFMAVLFIGWAIYLIYCLVKFRARPGVQSTQTHQHFKLPTYLEIAIVFFEVFLLFFLSSPIWNRYRTHFPAEGTALVVRVVAEQFAWNIHYPGIDRKFGRQKLELIDGTNPIGLDREDPDAKDDIVTINNFHVPVDKPVIVHLSSKDVIHSFSVPVLRVKMDVVPGIPSSIWFEAKEAGEYEIACAQLCGMGHYRMRGQFFVDTPEVYKKFIDEELASISGGT